MASAGSGSMSMGRQSSEFREACSVETFRATSVVDFQERVRTLFQKSFSKLKSNILEHSLASLDWKSLCEHHDRQQRRNDNRRDDFSASHNTTPLQAILSTMLNPTIVPYAWSQKQLKLLLFALLQSPRQQKAKMSSSDGGRWTASQSLLLRHCTTLLNSRPSCDPAILDSFLSAPDISSETISIYYCPSPHSINRLLSALHHLARESSQVKFGIGTLILKIIALADKLDEPFDSDGQDQNCAHQWQPAKKRKFMRGLQLEQLHNNYEFGRDGSEQVTHHSTCSDAHDKTANPSTAWKLVRRRALQKFLTFVSQNRSIRHNPSLNSLLRNDAERSRPLDTSAVLQLACHYYQAPSYRTILHLIGRDKKGKGLAQYYCEICRECCKHFSKTYNEAFLRIYSEMIVTSTVFDDRRTCWEAMKRLSTILSQHNKSCSKDIVSSSKAVVACVSFLIYDKQDLLESSRNDEIHEGFKKLIALLRLKFATRELWVRNGFPESLHIARHFDILSFSDEDLLEDDQGEKPFESINSAISSWPFAESHSMKAFLVRTGLDEPKIQSSFSIPTLQSDTKQVDTGTPKSSFRMFESTSDEIVMHIFSYLSCTDLSSMRLTSKSMKVQADMNVLWYELYMSHFPSAREETYQGDMRPKVDWKAKLAENYVATQNLQFKRNQRTGWKWSICDYVGCLHVLRSQDQQEKHYRMHDRKRSAGRDKNNRKRKEKRRHESSSLRTTVAEPKDKISSAIKKPQPQKNPSSVSIKE